MALADRKRWGCFPSTGRRQWEHVPLTYRLKQQDQVCVPLEGRQQQGLLPLAEWCQRRRNRVPSAARQPGELEWRLPLLVPAAHLHLSRKPVSLLGRRCCLPLPEDEAFAGKRRKERRP
mmetsp:Transcript_9956/g.28562  ORF Transcript_9956/g.28562 Transcript_9956/m.28562 type:complete len:119 (-) Transcript_9956:44-400(-)